jgi:hypothetical protein
MSIIHDCARMASAQGEGARAQPPQMSQPTVGRRRDGRLGGYKNEEADAGAEQHDEAHKSLLPGGQTVHSRLSQRGALPRVYMLHNGQ